MEGNQEEMMFALSVVCYSKNAEPSSSTLKDVRVEQKCARQICWILPSRMMTFSEKFAKPSRRPATPSLLSVCPSCLCRVSSFVLSWMNSVVLYGGTWFGTNLLEPRGASLCNSKNGMQSQHRQSLAPSHGQFMLKQTREISSRRLSGCCIMNMQSPRWIRPSILARKLILYVDSEGLKSEAFWPLPVDRSVAVQTRRVFATNGKNWSYFLAVTQDYNLKTCFFFIIIIILLFSKPHQLPTRFFSVLI